MEVLFSAARNNRHVKIPESQQERPDGLEKNARYVLFRQHDNSMEYVNTPEESPLLALVRAIEK